MVLSFGRKVLGRRIALPWASIDSSEGIEPTTWEPEKDAEEEESQWFLDSPPGNWQMETPANLPKNAGDQADDDNRSVPFETLPEDVEEEEAYPPRQAAETGAWTISMMCMGLGLIAACLIIPQADSNRRLVYQREQLRLDLAQVQKQISVNKEFLAKMESDPQLTERLAQREMRAVEQGEAVVNLSDDVTGQNTSAGQMSPFSLVKVPPPPALPPYQPVGGSFAELCRNSQSHIYLLGAGMIMVASGLVLGGSGRTIGSAEANPNLTLLNQ